MKKQSFWKKILFYADKYRRNFFWAIVFSLITGVFVAIQPLIIKEIIDDGIQNMSLEPTDRIKAVLFYCCFYLVVHILRMTVWTFGYRNMLIGLEGFLFKIRSSFFNHLQTLCMRFYDETSSGELFNYIMGSPMTNLKNFLSQFALNVPHQTVAMVISLVALLSYDWFLTVVMMVMVFVSVCLNRYSARKIKKLAVDMLKSESEASRYIDDVLHGSRAIKIYAIEEGISGNFEKYMSSLKDKGVKLSFNQWIENAKPELVQVISTMSIYFIGAISCIYRGLTLGELTAFISCMGTIHGSLNMWFSVNLMKSNAEAALDKLESVLHASTTTPDKEEFVRSIEVEKSRAIRKGEACIEFKDVTFGYDSRKIFDHFNCKMKYNKSYALVGASGSGKSTITKLIMRLYEVENGEIRMHNNNIKNYSLHDLRTSIGIVPQDPFMFRTTILENIRIACPEAPMREIMEAMEVARVHEFVNELPDGWNTMVGEDGFGLSGGQKQRIAIARAILGKPDILIFDEATSALDNVSETHIQNAMEDLMKTHTVIMIAHRLTTVRNVDTIFVFDKGQIVQEGSYDELSKCEGTFKELLDSGIS